MIESFLELLLQHWPWVLVITFAAWLTSNRFNHELNKFNGPFLASLTDWWRFVDVYRRRPDITHNRLHQKYGDIVRLGPNALSFADPKAIKVIYGLNKGFRKVRTPAPSCSVADTEKSGFYPVQQSTSKGERLPSLFSTTDEAFHAQLRRSVNNAFSMSALVQYEAGVDLITERFLDQTNNLYAFRQISCDFAQWLQYYAFDVIGQITYSKSHGFVDRNEDVDGMVGYLGKLFSYVAPVDFQGDFGLLRLVD